MSYPGLYVGDHSQLMDANQSLKRNICINRINVQIANVK